MALALTIVGAGLSLLAPYLVKVAIDEHIAVGDVSGLTGVILVTLVVYLANFLASSRQIVIMSEVGQEILMTMRAELFRHLQRLPLAYFQANPTGVIVSRLINDVLVLNDLLTNGLLNLFTDVFMLVSTIAIMLVLSAQDNKDKQLEQRPTNTSTSVVTVPPSPADAPPPSETP